MTELVLDAIKEANIPEVKEIIDGGPQPPSEDFSFYAKERPSCFFYVGAKKEDAPYPHPPYKVWHKRRCHGNLCQINGSSYSKIFNGRLVLKLLRDRMKVLSFSFAIYFFIIRV